VDHFNTICVYSDWNMVMGKSLGLNRIELSSGKFDAAHCSDAASLAQTFSNLTAAQPKSLVIHFHGGLVGRDTALASAQQLAPLYRGAGAESLFVIWETSVTEILDQNVERIVNEPIFQSLLLRVTEFVKGKLAKAAGARGVSELPKTMGYEIEAELKKGRDGQGMFEDEEFTGPSPEQAPSPDDTLTFEEKDYIEEEINKDADIKMQVAEILATPAKADSKGVTGGEAQATLMDSEVLKSLVPEEEDEKSKSILGTILVGKRVVTIVGAVIWRYANRRDHGLYLTVVEEIMRAFYVRAAGRFLWSEMKDAVANAFAHKDSGGTALVEQLKAFWKPSKPCVTLVGHSAGAIYVVRLVKELNKVMDPDFRINVVLIAPACTFDYLADALAGAGNRVANLRIFGMSDPVERNDHLVPAIYPASLLYFVSGVLEDERDQPLAGMQRYYSAESYGATFKSIADVKAFPHLSGTHSYAWSQIGGFDGANCDMIRHGGWAEAPGTLASVLYLIQGGCSNAW
jgi:hypothetical protein